MHLDGGKWWLLRVTPLAGQDGRVWRLIGNAMPSAEGRAWLFFVVSDTGIGISGERLQEIFG